MRNQFSKVLNASDILVTAFGAMIGWGWVVATGGWLQSAGTVGSVLGFVIGGLMIYFVGLTYAELTSAMPQCGGELVFSYKAFGVTGSFICTWFLILSYIGVVCYEACALPTIIQYIFPGFLKGYMYTVAGFDIYATWVVAAVVATAIIVYINLRGIKAAAILQTILTVAIAAVGIALVVASAINGDPTNLEGQFIVGANWGDSAMNIISVAVVAPFFLFGFDVIPQVAEEIKVPFKKVGRIILLSIILAVAFYSSVVFAVGYGMNTSDVAAASGGAGLVTADAMAKLFNSATMAKVLIIGGMCGIITSWNSFLIGGSRAIYAMAEANMLPRLFTKMSDKRKTPTNAILLIGILSILAPFFGKAMFGWISNSASFACCTAYCFVALSFLRLRKKEPALHRPFKVKKYRFIGIMAVIMSGFLVVMYIIPGISSSLKYQEWIIVGGWVLLGAAFYLSSRYKYGDSFGMVYSKAPAAPHDAAGTTR